MKLVLIACVALASCINQKEKLVGQQAVVEAKMDSVEVYKGAMMMLIHEWKTDKKWDSFSKTPEGRTYYMTLQKEYERHNSAFKQFSKQYDSLEKEIQKQ